MSDVVESIIQRHAVLRNGSEVAWAIWAAIELEIDLSAGAAGHVSTMEDDIVALVALDARRRGRFPTGLDPKTWRGFVQDPGALTGPHWLLTYESQRKGWLRSGRTLVQTDPFFSLLDRARVSFYETRPLRAPFTGTAGPGLGSALPSWYV
jgi:hypothetical protein